MNFDFFKKVSSAEYVVGFDKVVDAYLHEIGQRSWYELLSPVQLERRPEPHPPYLPRPLPVTILLEERVIEKCRYYRELARLGKQIFAFIHTNISI